MSARQGVRAWDPVDLLEGYHAVPRGQAWQVGLVVGKNVALGHRVVGLRQIDGMPHKPQRARSSMIAKRQYSIATSATRPHRPGARARIGRD
jgi:hypothetical protein